MKMKVVPLLLMFLMVVALAQPIFARPHDGDTKITGADDQPLKDINVQSGEFIKFKAELWWYSSTTRGSNDWGYSIAQPCDLEFYVYETNQDGTNGDLVYNDVASSGWIQKYAETRDCLIIPKGTYNLLVKFEGDKILKPSSATAKINVV